MSSDQSFVRLARLYRPLPTLNLSLPWIVLRYHKVVVDNDRIHRFQRDVSTGHLTSFDTTVLPYGNPIVVATSDPAGDYVVSVSAISGLSLGNLLLGAECRAPEEQCAKICQSERFADGLKQVALSKAPPRFVGHQMSARNQGSPKTRIDPQGARLARVLSVSF